VSHILQTTDRGREPLESHLVASVIERVRGEDRMLDEARHAETAMHEWWWDDRRAGIDRASDRKRVHVALTENKPA